MVELGDRPLFEREACLKQELQARVHLKQHLVCSSTLPLGLSITLSSLNLELCSGRQPTSFRHRATKSQPLKRTPLRDLDQNSFRPTANSYPIRHRDG